MELCTTKKSYEFHNFCIKVSVSFHSIFHQLSDVPLNLRLPTIDQDYFRLEGGCV